MQITCVLAPKSNNNRPMVSAVVPPTPTSASSKIRLGSWVVLAATICMLKKMRVCSPPEATFLERPVRISG